MQNNSIKEIIVSFVLIVLAILLLNPFNFWMIDMMTAGILVCALIAFGLFASFILREKSFDERDDVHRTLAGRNAFLAGSLILMVGITVQWYTHTIDSWLVIALIVMIFTKIATRFWSDRNL